MLYPSLKQRLENQHTTITEIIAKLDNEKLQFRLAPDKWSITDIIAHMATYQPVFIYRINQILAVEDPSFPRYRADDEAAFIAAREKAVAELIAIISAERQQIIELIMGLPDDKLSRKGLHPKYGNLSIVEWTEFFLLHEAHHLFTIFQLANGDR